MTVVDASVLIPALADDGEAGARFRAALGAAPPVAPHLLDLEVVSYLRRQVRSGVMLEQRARQALTDLVDLPLVRAPHVALLPRCWELRENLTSYDAAYVALAEALDEPLLTADARLASAPGVRCEVQLLT